MTSASARSVRDLSEGPSEILQERPEDAPVGWAEVQDRIAADAGLAVLLVDGYQPPALVVSNNNSICHAFQSSPEHVGLCDPFCGDAHRRAVGAGSRVDYKCHAGLHCFTMPVQIGKRQDLAVIGGRAFVSGADYRSLVERFRAGELNELLSRNPFENVIFAEPQRLEQLARKLEKAGSATEAQSAKIEVENQNIGADLAIGKASSGLSTGGGLGSPIGQPDAGSDRVAGNASNAEQDSSDAGDERPLANEPTADLQREVDRLRGELEYRTHLDESLHSFLERISSTDPHKTYESILTHSRELLQAERASLWVLDEGANEMILRAGSGLSAEVGPDARTGLTESIAGTVLESGRALVVENVDDTKLTPAPAERNYRTKSFISYPLTIGVRKIGLLNLTDKSSGESFNDVDLSLLEIIGPQIAVALERAEWQERATQFQLMSITDPLTGLLNRRYLEERLTEELNRSKRYNYSMSCLMIDIDDFKNYNDRNGHQAGDLALKITAHSLKAALRSADIACRYGGEEFCILLPQTSVTEAGVIAERMRQKVTETDYPYGKSQPTGTVSISIGISTFGRNIDTAESVIAAADRALYNAKRKGKNRLEFYVDNLTGTPSSK
ncbi:MAG: diguanylate cyclase [Acidobacteriota bacterium]